MRFHMLDSTDMSRIKYQKVNANTQKEVPREKIVKGYEFEENNYIILTNEDFKKANPKATQTIEIQNFVEEDAIDPSFFYRPYYVHPGPRGEKSYVLLRETLSKTNKVGVAKIVMQAKEHLCAIMVRDKLIVLELLRFGHELRKADMEDIPLDPPKELGLREAEIKMAEQLVNEMTEKWNPRQYQDTYQKDLQAFVEEKIKKGKAARGRVEEGKELISDAGKVVDFVSLLKKSLEKTGKAKKSAETHRRRA